MTKEIKDLDALLGYQDCTKVPDKAWNYARAVIAGKTPLNSLFWLVCSLYNYGYIEGQRAERARRKRGTTA